MTEKIFSTQITKLSAETPSVYVFAIQAGVGGEPITGAQIETARNAAISVLEITGADVAATSSIIALDPIGANQSGRLLIYCTQEIDGDN